MAVLIGDVQAQDEFMHAVSDDPHFSENMLFTFFARDGSHGGLVRIGNRANEGHAEVTFLVFLPDGRTLFQFRRHPIEGNTKFSAAGMEFEVIEPTERLRTSFAGTAIAMTDSLQLANPGLAFKSNPSVDVRFDVIQHAVSALYLPMPFHYEQHMHAVGTLDVDGERIPIDAYGVRDHTWGRRNWQATLCDRTIWCTLSDERGFALSVTWHDLENPPEVMGSMVTKSGMIKVEKADIHSRYQPDGLTHTGFTCGLVLADGEELTLEGHTSRVAPLRHRGPEHMTYIGQGMTQFTAGKETAFGLSEYMDLVIDGKRAYPAG